MDFYNNINNELIDTMNMVKCQKASELFDANYWKKTLLELIRQNQFLIVDNRNTAGGVCGHSLHEHNFLIIKGDPKFTKMSLDINQILQEGAKCDIYTKVDGIRRGNEYMSYTVTNPFHKKFISQVVIPLKLKWEIFRHFKGEKGERIMISWEHWATLTTE